MKYGVCIRVLGDLELLPKDVLEAVARAVNLTRDNDQAFLNVCFSYTSRHEMTAAIRRLAQGTEEGMIHPRSVCKLNCYSWNPSIRTRSLKLGHFITLKFSRYQDNYYW